jgi:hypothetical protein
MFKRLPLFTFIIIAPVLFSACTRRSAQTVQPTASPIETGMTASPAATSATPSSTIEVSAEYEFTAEREGQVALDLLSSSVKVETKNYGEAGDFVTSINGLAGDSGHYWAFYVNDKYAEKGVSQTILKKGDRIKFVYEKVSPSN